MKSLYIKALSSSALKPSSAEDVICDPNLREPTVFLLIEAQTGVKGLEAGTPRILKCLSDSGAFQSCMVQSVAQDLQIPVSTDPPGDLVLADGSRKPRIGMTSPIDVTLIFWGGNSTTPCPKPIHLQHSFEIIPAGPDAHESNGHQAIFGRDLMNKAKEHLQRIGENPAEKLFAFVTGLECTAGPGGGAVPANTPLSTTVASILASAEASIRAASGKPPTAPASTDNFSLPTLEPIPDEVAAYDEDEELKATHMEFSTDAELEEEYSRRRTELMRHPDVVRELEVNSRITGTINHPEAVVRLRLKDGVDPRKLNRMQYNIPMAKRHIVDEKVADLRSRGRVERAKYDAERPNVNCPLMCAPKKSGGEIIPGTGRVCIDPRVVNANLACDDKFEIPQIRRQLEKFAGKRIFGELDMEEAFHQFLVHEDSRHLLCFTWNSIQLQWTCMPFGVYLMTSLCHRFISDRIQEAELQDICDPFVDNMPFASQTWDEHREHLVTLLRFCNSLNIKIKASAIKVGHSRMKCLGHIISADGVSIDPLKMETVKQWPRPETGQQMESFLGFTAFIRQHIRHYAELSAPLVDVKHDKTIEWTDTMIHSFETLKAAVVNAPILRYPDYSRPFYVATDASNLGCGGVLYQPEPGKSDVTANNIVAICAKKWAQPQLRYSAYKKELFGLVYCLRKFHQYIWGRPDTVVFTDHKPLTYMFTQPEPPVVLQQWMDLILDYSFTIHHRPGIMNVVPDQLSRMFADAYKDATWGVPPHIRFAGLSEADRAAQMLNVSLKSLQCASSRGEKSASHTSADSHRPVRIANLQVEMERRGKTVPSEDQRERLIQQQHALGHFGRDAIFAKLYDELNLWWPNMRQQIQLAVRQCDACARFVVTKAGFKPAQYITAPGPWHHIQFDCSVKLPKSDPGGYTALLVVIDVFSGFVVLYPIKTTSAACVAEKLWELCCLFGFPNILQSDNGPEFANAVVRELTELMKISHRFIAPYNPRCDGKVERAISIVMGVIKKLLQGADQFWPLFCPMAQLCVNNRISRITQSTPFALLFARDNAVMGPWGGEDGAADDIAAIEEWKKYQRRVLDVIFPSIFAKTERSKKKMAQAVDKKRKRISEDAFPVGSWVALRDPNKENKRDPAFFIKYQVLRKDRNNNLVIREDLPDGKTLERHVPPDQLKAIANAADSAEAEGDEQAYEVERILKHRGKHPRLSYLVLWRGYPIEQATWEDSAQFLDTQVVRDYWKARNDASAAKSTKAARK